MRYSRIDIIGKGGSSKVWRVINSENQILALKKVDIKSYDKESRESFINEIELLERLRGHPQIIGLIAAEMNDKSLMMVSFIFSFPFLSLSLFLCHFFTSSRCDEFVSERDVETDMKLGYGIRGSRS